MTLVLDISMSLDGFVAGPNPSREEPLGVGGERLHEWVVGTDAWRRQHRMEGGERTADAELVEEGIARMGAVVMGRGMFGGGPGPWQEPAWEGWWGEEPPFGVPVFVLTHHPREVLPRAGGTRFSFVTDGIEAALEQASAVAGNREVALAGGAHVVQQYIRAGLLDELQIHLVPILLGGGVRLFDWLGPDPVELEQTRVIASPALTHLRYRVVR
jgi:dihydrofolate reductase